MRIGALVLYEKNKIVALIVLGIILLQIVIPSLADIDWNVVFAEESNTWDISQNGDGSVMATLSDDGTLTISGNGKMKDWRNSSDEAWDSNRKNIKNVIINNGVTSIGNFAFSDCTSLTNITIPNSVTSIGDYAFWYCNLKNITIPNGVTSIGYSAFYRCTSLTNITIPNSVTSIGDFAFNECTSLTNIAIPDSVTSIGDHAFYKCDSLSVLCKSNSYAEQYAKENNIKYVIDDSVPTIKNVTGNEKWTKDKVILTVNAEDSLSGLATEAYSFDNGQTWQKENTKTYTENTQGIIIKVRDAVGNVATYKTIDINNILKIEISNYEKITKDNNEYLTKIEANTTIAQLKEKIKTNGTIKVLKGNNEITDTNTLVGTGMQIQIETEKYIAIVKADLNGDGKIGLSDLSNIKFSLIGKKQLSTEAQIAGDINGDGKVSLSDMAKLKMYLVGKANI